MNDFPFVIKELRYILWAYNLIWIILALYLGFLLIRLNRLSKEIRKLAETDTRRAGPG